MDQAGGAGRKIYGLSLLTLASSISIMDRSIAGILQEPIRHEFHLNDSALGLMTGLAFALPYIVTIPSGLIADRVERSRLIAACLAFWSLMTALCGLATGFPQLVAARMAVALGEAASAPAAQSIIADLFSQRRRGTALGVYLLAIPVGSTLAFTVGGTLAARYGWRTAFLAAGGPGLVLSLLIFLTFRAPPRGGAAAVVSKPPSLREAFTFILSQRALKHVIIGSTIGQLVVGAIGVWSASFFVRYHHLNVREVGLALGPIGGLAGVLGLLGGGLLADRAGRKDPARAFRVIIGSLVLITPTALAIFVMRALAPAFIAWSLYLLISFIWMAGASALVQNLAGGARRSTIAGINLTLVGLVGAGLGPQLAGNISDLLKPLAGAESLRWSLVGFAVLSLWAAAHMAMARRTYLADLERAAQP